MPSSNSNKRKKILFLTYDFPYPFNSGGKIRAFNLLRYAGKGFDIHLFSFTRGDISARQQKKLQDIGINQIYLQKRPSPHLLAKAKSIVSSKSSIFKSLYYSPEAEQKLIHIIKEHNINVLHAESFYTSFYLNQELKKTGVKTVFGTENVEYRIYDDYVRNSVHPLLRSVYRLEVNKIKKEEEQALLSADAVISVTDEEAREFHSLTHKPCTVVENGIDLEYFAYQLKRLNPVFTILFVGNFKYFPNIEAAKFLYERIYKKLEKGSAELVIVGKNVEKLPIPMERGIRLVDYVEDIREIYKKADVLVSPVTLGGGTSFKTLEAMAMGVPIIAHEVRMKPLGAIDRKHYLAAETPTEYLESIQFIQQNPQKVKTLTSQARKFVENNYSWQVIGKKLQEAWREL